MATSREEKLKSLAKARAGWCCLGWSPADLVLLFRVPDIWIILTQVFDVVLDLVFFVFSDDIGNVVYGGKEPVRGRAL